MKSDLEIAQSAEMLPISKIAESINLSEEDYECYGRYKAKISDSYIRKIEGNKDGKLILVTAINPTPAGEGKTTTSVGLADAFHKLDKKVMLALRAAVATVLHLRAVMLAAIGADDVVAPACLCQCLLADAVCSEVLCH